MKLEITSPDKQIFSGDVDLVQLPGCDGLFEILHNHAPMIASLGKGKIKVQDEEGKLQYFEIRGGVCEVLENKITVLAE
ncbi:MAG: ATP synthase F1 subunit epsilon [Bacteroidales bacterium]|nr:ATP synthase F1 subunit epsilon [Bacteroidales bacterium]